MAQDHAFAELIQEYISECLPLAEGVNDVCLALERRWDAGDLDAAAVAGLKGTLHTVKGNSAMMGLRAMQLVAHALEDLAGRIAADEAARGEAESALLVEGSGLLVDLIRAAAEPDRGIGAAEDFVAQVRSHLTAGPAGAPSAPLRLERRGADRRAEAGPDASTVRVDFRRLDALLEIFGEAMIEQSALAEVYRRLASRVEPGPELADLVRVVGALGATMKRLETALMQTRLLPISTVFGRFTRSVRDLARDERKRVRLVIEGGDTLLDKTILDRLGEPLVHLLSNAVVHGVERESDRAAAGKPAEATIGLRASALADRVVITVSDDGLGLDTDRILAKAKALGLEAPSTAADVYGLIFLPGFSTAEQVSHVAGRGVGLDAAAAAIHDLGGGIEVASQPGRGITFTLSVSLTLAIVRSLIVEVDRERYAVPLSHVAETVRVEPGALHEINRQGVVMWRGSAIHVADGGRLLGTGTTRTAPRNYFVVLCAGPRRRGVLVDRLVGHQDVVVKRLDPTLGRPDVVSGATILGDGRVACILDAAGIVAQREAA